jgi:hypothetical protein
VDAQWEKKWDDYAAEFLMRKTQEEMFELYLALNKIPEDPDTIRKKCNDIANCVMTIAEKWGRT